MLSRRTFTFGAIAAGMYGGAVPHVRAADPSFWGWVALKLGEGAIAYIGGRLLSQVIGDVSNQQLLDAIEGAVKDIKSYVFVQTRAAVIEGEVRQVRAFCGAADIAMRDYAATPSREALAKAYSANLDAITLSSEMREIGLPTFAVSVSQRALIVAAIANEYKDYSVLDQYKRDLRGLYSIYANGSVTSYIKSLSPDYRIQNFACLPGRPDDSWRMSRSCGGGFCAKPPSMQCTVTIDGQGTVLSEGDYYNGDDWDHVTGLGQSRLSSIVDSCRSYQEAAKTALEKPIADVVKKWDEVASG